MMSREDTNAVPPDAGEINSQVTYSPESDSFQYAMDTSCYSITEAVVSSVAVATERDPIDLPPLYSAIDPDALDALFSSAFDQGSSRAIRVSFEYADCRVIVEDQETVRVKPFNETTVDAE